MMWLPWRKSQEFAPLPYEDATVERFVDDATADGASWKDDSFDKELSEDSSWQQ